MKKILGIAAYYHDSSACLLIDGKIIAAVQEERFSRIKHDSNFPQKAIEYCLTEGDCQLETLDAVIFYDKPMLKFERLLETYLALAPKGFLSFLKAMPVWLKQKLFLKAILRQELTALIAEQSRQHNAFAQGGRVRKNDFKKWNHRESKQKPQKTKIPPLLFSEHHQSHAASAYFPSPFTKAAVICLDGVGEWATSSVWLGENNRLKPLWEIQFPHSLGLLYSAFTYYCGFRVNSGEYKLMGLAPYGQPKYVDRIYQHLIKVKEDGSFALNMKYFNYPVGKVMTNAAFNQLFNRPARDVNTQVTVMDMDLARSIQQVCEEIVLKIARYARQQTACENLCLAGGVALNCVANGRLQRESPFKNIWIQPAAGDAGGSLGAAFLAWHEYFEQAKTPFKLLEPLNQCSFNQASSKQHSFADLPSDHMQGSYLGPAFSDSQIADYLQSEQIKFEVLTESALYQTVADLIAQGKVVGWFQDRMEFGPRALGNRSIIGDPRCKKMQTMMNLKIKNRESFRPFAPAVLAEDVAEYFQQNSASPYMLFVSKITKKYRLMLTSEQKLEGFEQLKQARSQLPAITHVDFSARIQTVHQATNPKFHALLTAFKAKTGVAVLINTSFNVRGEPPVCAPQDALQCFLRTEMDYLVMGQAIIDKKQMTSLAISQARKQQFEMD